MVDRQSNCFTEINFIVNRKERDAFGHPFFSPLSLSHCRPMKEGKHAQRTFYRVLSLANGPYLFWSSIFDSIKFRFQSHECACWDDRSNHPRACCHLSVAFNCLTCHALIRLFSSCSMHRWFSKNILLLLLWSHVVCFSRCVNQQRETFFDCTNCAWLSLHIRRQTMPEGFFFRTSAVLINHSPRVAWLDSSFDFHHDKRQWKLN